jgi:formylglycine-generating enzyme required for sulfatase activity
VADEGPQREVTISRSFAVGRFAVSRAEWRACVEGGGCGAGTPTDGPRTDDRHPVVNVSFSEAKAYTDWLSRVTGKRYRLLTEAEREYVGRAGSRSAYWWGGSIGPRQANYRAMALNTAEAGTSAPRRTLPIDFFAPNPWGLYQVHGNVAEWVEDCFEPGYADAPADGSARAVPSCRHRVTRGGSWLDGPERLRSASRTSAEPDRRAGTIGFRVAREP